MCFFKNMFFLCNLEDHLLIVDSFGDKNRIIKNKRENIKKQSSHLEIKRNQKLKLYFDFRDSDKELIMFKER